MNDFIKLAEYNNDEYGLLTEFLDSNSNILFAYTKFYNNKYTYEFVSSEINDKLMEMYLSYDK